jgi:hypothetical protein
METNELSHDFNNYQLTKCLSQDTESFPSCLNPSGTGLAHSVKLNSEPRLKVAPGLSTDIPLRNILKKPRAQMPQVINH